MDWPLAEFGANQARTVDQAQTVALPPPHLDEGCGTGHGDTLVDALRCWNPSVPPRTTLLSGPKETTQTIFLLYYCYGSNVRCLFDHLFFNSFRLA